MTLFYLSNLSKNKEEIRLAKGHIVLVDDKTRDTFI